MSFWRWLRLCCTWNAVCEGGPFDGEVRSSSYDRIIVSLDGTEWRFHFDDSGRVSPYDLGVYMRAGRRFVWCNAKDDARPNREKIERFLEVERVIREVTSL